jgi:hypothetical protein
MFFANGYHLARMGRGLRATPKDMTVGRPFGRVNPGQVPQCAEGEGNQSRLPRKSCASSGVKPRRLA